MPEQARRFGVGIHLQLGGLRQPDLLLLPLGTIRLHLSLDSLAHLLRNVEHAQLLILSQKVMAELIQPGIGNAIE